MLLPYSTEDALTLLLLPYSTEDALTLLLLPYSTEDALTLLLLPYSTEDAEKKEEEVIGTEGRHKAAYSIDQHGREESSSASKHIS